MMHSDQIYIDTEIARELVFEQFPQYRHEQIVKINGSGTVNAIFKIGSVATARFPLREMSPTKCFAMLSDEARNMARFAECSPAASPLPIGLGSPNKRYPMPWAIQSWLKGEAATPESQSDSTSFALEIAKLIATLRLADTNGQRFDGKGRGGNLRDHDNWMSICFEKSEGLLDVPKLRQIWQRLHNLPPSGSDGMCHKDLIPPNLLVSSDSLVGVLDSGNFGPADRALDLVAVWHLFNRKQREVIRNHLASSDTEWKRGAAWAFQQAIGLVWYYENSNKVMSELGRSTLSRILKDPDI